MKENLHSLFATTMSLLLLASTVSWTVEKHYCMGHLMDVSFFANAEDCGMGMPMSEDANSRMVDESSCCNDELMVVVGQNDLKVSFDEINLDQQLFLIAFARSYFHLSGDLAKRPVPQEHYPPPLLVKNIQLLDEVFII